MDAAAAGAARIVLAAVLVYAAGGKLRSRGELPRQLAALAVPRRVAPAVAVALPVAEATIAVALLVAPRSAAPAWAAVALLAAFTAAILVALARDVRAPCACFGAASDAPISARTVVRNGWLLALAVLGTGTSGGASWPATLVAVAVLGVLTLLVLRSFG